MSSSTVLAQSVAWWHSGWKYRTPITLTPSTTQDAITTLTFNVNSLKNQAASTQAISLQSLRIFDHLHNTLLTSQILTHNTTTGVVELVVYLPVSPATPQLYLYFDTHQALPPLPQIPPLITVTEAQHQEQASVIITTPQAKYAFHKQGGGLASMWDKEQHDWISFNRTAGSAGMFRGIPNMVNPGDIFHPGHTHATTTITTQGPLFLELKSTAEEGGWETVWQFFPQHAHLKVTKSPANSKYWFLYEGTPGGSITNTNTQKDRYTLANGSSYDIDVTKEGDLPNPEWIYFHDPSFTRSLFLLHHQNDSATDRYYLMQNNMTVFGFGREGLNKFLSGNHSFTLGFIESKSHTQVSQVVNQHLSPSTATIGTVEINNQPTPTSTLPSITPTTTPTAADFNVDGKVDIQDLIMFIPRFDKTNALYNLNGTGKVDAYDFSLLISNLFKE